MGKLKFIFIFLTLTTLLSTTGFASSSDNSHSLQKVAVLNFSVLDEQGNLIDPLHLQHTELLSLSRTMAMGIASRLVQYRNFDVYDPMLLREKKNIAPFPPEMSPYEQAQILLTQHGFDQVITGSITSMPNIVVLGVQRFDLEDDKPRLLGSSMATAPRTSDAPAQIDSLLSILFPPETPVIERSIEQVFVAPSMLRISLGSSHKINPLALDSLGRPVPDPTFLYISSDETRVHVDDNGVITALKPGTTTVSIRGVSRSASSGSPATMTVVVVPPVFGIRVGSLIPDAFEGGNFPVKMGFRFTPSFDQGGPKDPLAEASKAASADPTNPLAYIGTFFSSLFSSGIMTFDLDFDPSDELLFALSGIQRTSSGFIGTGVGYATPLGMSETKGFVFRFTAGTQIFSFSRVTLPVEANVDMIFPTSGTGRPSFRFGVNFGLDLFPL